MFTSDPTDLIGEYLFEAPLADGTVRNTANPGTLDGQIVDGAFSLDASADVPPNFQGAVSLDYDVLRSAGSAAGVTQADTQLVRVANFPDPPANELTLEAWVKVDYFPPDTYPNGKVGFGVSMALDKSGSMSWASGLNEPLETRLDVLHFSAPPFVELLEDDNSVGIVSFDQDPHPVISMTPTDLGGRIAIQSAILGHTNNPLGATAIGDGLEAAQTLIAPVTGFDSKAIVILTDGHETAGKYISEVTDLINDRVFAIGLGTAEQLQPAALQALTDGPDGYLLMTGQLLTDDFFRAASIQVVANTLQNVNSVLAEFGALSRQILLQSQFAVRLADTLELGIGNLVDADLARESANLHAFQVKQELGIQALSIANQAPQAILQLFR